LARQPRQKNKNSARKILAIGALPIKLMGKDMLRLGLRAGPLSNLPTGSPWLDERLLRLLLNSNLEHIAGGLV
jgi:hypothetical protein